MVFIGANPLRISGFFRHSCFVIRHLAIGEQIELNNHMSAESRIHELKLELPPAPKPVAVYKPVVLAGNLAYVSGHGPIKSDKSLITGRVGADLDLQAGKAAARQTGLAILATLRRHLGSLDRVAR